MSSQVQLRRPFRRHRFACFTSHNLGVYASSSKSGRGRAYGSSAAPLSKPARPGKAFIYTTGLGIASASLYYVLINGPSRAAPTSASAPLSSTHFTPLTVTSSISCTPYTKLLTFSLPAHLISSTTETRAPPIYSIYIKDSDIQVERPYTPLEGIDAEGQMRFWVKRYQGGEVGRWLHDRKVGDQIEVRGPVHNWEWKDGVWDEIVMISGGTGITPFYQLLYGLFSPTSENALPRTHFTLLHSSPTPLDLPPPSLLDPLRSLAQSQPNVFSLRIFVDTADPKTSRQDLPELAVGRIGRKAVAQALIHLIPKASPWWIRMGSTSSVRSEQVEKKILFLVCGPEPMVAAIAGPRAHNLGQGRVSGVLGEMGFGAHQVWKL